MSGIDFRLGAGALVLLVGVLYSIDAAIDGSYIGSVGWAISMIAVAGFVAGLWSPFENWGAYAILTLLATPFVVASAVLDSKALDSTRQAAHLNVVSDLVWIAGGMYGPASAEVGRAAERAIRVCGTQRHSDALNMLIGVQSGLTLGPTSSLALEAAKRVLSDDARPRDCRQALEDVQVVAPQQAGWLLEKYGKAVQR